MPRPKSKKQLENADLFTDSEKLAVYMERQNQALSEPWFISTPDLRASTQKALSIGARKIRALEAELAALKAGPEHTATCVQEIDKAFKRGFDKGRAEAEKALRDEAGAVLAVCAKAREERLREQGFDAVSEEQKVNNRLVNWP